MHCRRTPGPDTTEETEKGENAVTTERKYLGIRKHSLTPVPQIDLSEIEEEGIDPREIGHVLDRIFLSIFLALTVCVTALLYHSCHLNLTRNHKLAMVTNTLENCNHM